MVEDGHINGCWKLSFPYLLVDDVYYLNKSIAFRFRKRKSCVLDLVYRLITTCMLANWCCASIGCSISSKRFVLPRVQSIIYSLFIFCYHIVMECNKEEAIRAKDIAEKKMKDNDFEGARKIGKRAQSLYPGLDNIIQLLTICDVHCSSQKRLFGYEKDWYAILQIKSLSDDVTVKKQYRRLALFLHPDKNRFPGAESAFKLICEANAVLSDPTKKSFYDNKIRSSTEHATEKIPTQHINKNPQFNKDHRAPSMASNGFNGSNLHQAGCSIPYARQEEFWTACPFCRVRYKYHREYVNRSLQCRNCSKIFTTYEMSVPLGTKFGQHGAQSTASNVGLNQTSAFHDKDSSNQSGFNMHVMNDKGFPDLSANSRGSFSKKKFQTKSGIRTGSGHSGAQRSTAKSGGSLNDNAYIKPIQQEPRMQTGSSAVDCRARAANCSEDLKAKESYFCNVQSSNSEKNPRMFNADSAIKEPGNLENKSRKRSRKQSVQSSENRDSSCESDTVNIATGKNAVNTATDTESEPTAVHYPRRSTRKRQHIIYDESVNNDNSNSLKSSCARKLSADSEEEKKDILNVDDSKPGNQKSSTVDMDCFKIKSEQMGATHTDGRSLDNDKDSAEECNDRGMSRTNANSVQNQSDSDQNSHSGDDSDGELYNVTDPEFTEFEKNRDGNNFVVNQVWALYDTEDGMPRFYAQVKKICISPFKLSFTWLEPAPNDVAEKKWARQGRPVGCGTFKLGASETTSRHRSISHQMSWEKGKRKGYFQIYPREGETWAIFKDWDINWTYKLDRELKYEVVEVLSDFVSGSGIKVCYLDKVSGFVSLFHRNRACESFLIETNELYKFSHLIPCSRMSGSEREGVPKGSFELDPASLPLNPDNLYYPSRPKMKSGDIDSSAVNKTPDP